MTIDTARLATDAAYWGELVEIINDTGGDPEYVADAIIAEGWTKP